MKYLIMLLVFITPNLARAEIVSLECSYDDGKYPQTITIDYTKRQVTDLKGTKDALITDSDITWSRIIVGNNAMQETYEKLNRFTGVLSSREVLRQLNADKTIGESKESWSLPMKCDVKKNRKF